MVGNQLKTGNEAIVIEKSQKPSGERGTSENSRPSTRFDSYIHKTNIGKKNIHIYAIKIYQEDFLIPEKLEKPEKIRKAILELRNRRRGEPEREECTQRLRILETRGSLGLFR